LASSSDYGSVPKELAKLQELVRFHEMKILMLDSQLDDMKVEMDFYLEWYAWKRASLEKTDAEIEELMGPEPTLSKFLRIRST